MLLVFCNSILNLTDFFHSIISMDVPIGSILNNRLIGSFVLMYQFSIGFIIKRSFLSYRFIRIDLSSYLIIFGIFFVRLKTSFAPILSSLIYRRTNSSFNRKLHPYRFFIHTYRSFVPTHQFLYLLHTYQYCDSCIYSFNS